MPRKKRIPSPFELYDDDFDEDASSQGSGHPPIQRNAANARERMRMRVLSSAYGRLKTKLPNIPPDTKLSKLDTLRLATLYIKQLIATVENGPNVSAGDSLDVNQMVDYGGIGGIGAFGNHHHGSHGSMSWPFEFHHMHQNSSRQLSLTPGRCDWNQSHAAISLDTQQFKHQRCHDVVPQTQNINNYQHQINEIQAHWYSQEMTSNNDMNNIGNNYETLHVQHLHHQQQQQHPQAL